MGLLAGICWAKSRSARYSLGLGGGVVTNDQCITCTSISLFFFTSTFQMCPFIMGVTVNDSFENLGDSLIALDESLGNLGQSLLLDDNLGESLFETSDNLGVSLCDSTVSEPVGFSETMNDSDNLGYSIIDQVFSDSELKSQKSWKRTLRLGTEM